MPAGATYEPIATTTLGSANSTISFTSISSGYTDLRFVLTGLLTVANNDIYVQFNTDTASNYSWTQMQGNGSTTSSTRGTSTTYIRASFGSPSATIPFLIMGDIFSYAGATNKTALVQYSGDQNGSGNVARFVGLWRSTSAITSVLLAVAGTTFQSGTTATLYGIKAA